MNKIINLEKLAGKFIYNKIEFMESDQQYRIITANLRNTKVKFYVESKRQLWQSLGQEYIEPEYLDFIDDISDGDILCDIGASTGIFSTYAALKGVRVYNFEPESQNFSLLEKNTYLNFENIKYPSKNFNIAISDKNELGCLYIEKFETAGHLKILDKPIKVFSESFLPEYVQTAIKYRLDDFIEKYSLSKPNYLKIDVDGSELAVIRGAPNVLKSKDLKKIFLEIEENSENQNEVMTLLADLNFKVKHKYQVQNYIGLYNLVLERD